MFIFVNIRFEIQLKISQAGKRLADATNHMVECARTCAGNSTNWYTWDQVELDRIAALRNAAESIRNYFGRNPDNEWELLLN